MMRHDLPMPLDFVAGVASVGVVCILDDLAEVGVEDGREQGAWSDRTVDRVVEVAGLHVEPSIRWCQVSKPKVNAA